MKNKMKRNKVDGQLKLDFSNSCFSSKYKELQGSVNKVAITQKVIALNPSTHTTGNIYRRILNRKME